MKKLLPSIMTVAFAIAITACGGRFDPPPTPEPTDTSATSTATATAKTAAESTEKPDIPAFVPDFEDISAEVPFVIDFASNISEEVLQGRESKWSLYSDTDEREKILFLSDREYTDFVLYTGDLEEDRFLLKQRKYSTWYWNPEIYLEYVIDNMSSTPNSVIGVVVFREFMDFDGKPYSYLLSYGANRKSVIISEVEIIDTEGFTVISFENRFHPAEFPLADGAKLVFEQDHMYSFCSAASVLYKDGESVYLFSDSEPMFEISPDLTKIAYFSDLFEHRGGVFEVFDIFAKESVCPEFDDYERSKRGEQTVTDTATTSFTWLDDEILLVVGAYMHGSATVGGWVYYYDITDGSNKRIIHGDGSRFHVNSIKKDGDNLDLEVALYHDGFNFMGNCVSEQIPISRIRSLIEKGETLTLDFPNIEDIEHECYLTELYGVCTSRVSQE